MVIMGPTTPCICSHTALWNINAIKQAINDKVQGSGGDVNNQIKESLLLSLSVKVFF